MKILSFGRKTSFAKNDTVYGENGKVCDKNACESPTVRGVYTCNTMMLGRGK
jgi:hypothetical protein